MTLHTPKKDSGQDLQYETDSPEFLARRELVRYLAGESFGELWNSPHSVLMAMAHSSTSVRVGAMLAGTTKWNLANSAEFRKACCQLAGTTDDQILPIVLTELGEIFFNSQNRNVKQILINNIRNSDLPNHIRNAAYRALRRVEFGLEYDTIIQKLHESMQFHSSDGDVSLCLIDFDLLDTIERDCG